MDDTENVMKAFGGSLLNPSRGGQMIRYFNAMTPKEYTKFKLSILRASGISHKDPRFSFLKLDNKKTRHVRKNKRNRGTRRR
jgi:hypothetical protein